MRVVGYMRGGRQPGLACDQPLRAVCMSCDRAEPWACGSHREDRCVPCSWKYRRRLARIALSGSRDHGYLYLLTLTAPGEKAHARKRIASWNPPNVSQPSTGFVVAPNDLCGCEHSMTSIGEWNVTAASRWNRLRTRLRQVHEDLEFFRAVETQKRGALHLHVVVWSSTPIDPLALQRLAVSVGFGCQMDLAPIIPGSRKHAYYVGKYVTKSTQERYAVPWNPVVVDEETGVMTSEPAPATYRCWSMSHGFGITMKQLREEGRRLVARNRAGHELVTSPASPGHELEREPTALCAASP